jgi:tetraprenyl-beta-curcumene synthase
VAPSLRAVAALAHALIRELLWGLRDVSREVERWRTLAESIPDESLRRDALAAIDRKRANIDGAALFWTLPRRRSKELLRLLVAYEILADFLDCTSERGARAGIRNGLQLHRALVDALNPRLKLSDYYRHHPWTVDGGYARSLVETCRHVCARMPSYDAVRPLATRAARLAQVLALNHETDAVRRDAALRAWAETYFPERPELAWFEWTGGASAWLTILALLALAAEPGRTRAEAETVYAVYLPWLSLAGTMLDSYGDIDEDAANGAHSYIGHYDSTEEAIHRLGAIIRYALKEADALRDGARHVVIASSMIAMYVSKDSTRAPASRALTAGITSSAGSLTHLLIPVLRVWRILNGQRAA